MEMWYHGLHAVQRYSKALVVLPYISVVAEKTEHLTTVLKAMKCKVKGYFGTGEGGVPLAPGSGSDPALALRLKPTLNPPHFDLVLPEPNPAPSLALLSPLLNLILPSLDPSCTLPHPDPTLIPA